MLLLDDFAFLAITTGTRVKDENTLLVLFVDMVSSLQGLLGLQIPVDEIQRTQLQTLHCEESTKPSRQFFSERRLTPPLRK